MIPQLSLPLDPGFAALLGAFIGAAATIIVQIVAAVVTARHETRTFRRTIQKETIANVANAYELALRIIFESMSSDGALTADAGGSLFARIALLGSPGVKKLVRSFLDAPHVFNIRATNDLVTAMQQHIEQLQSRPD